MTHPFQPEVTVRVKPTDKRERLQGRTGVIEKAIPIDKVYVFIKGEGRVIFDTRNLEVVHGVNNETARDFALQAHGDQKYGDFPYSYHLDAVAALVPEEYKTLAYLHDVLEDTSVTEDEILKHFGPDTLRGVRALTDPKGPNRKERKRLLHERLAGLGPEDCGVLIVKTADRLANLRESKRNNPTLLAMYRKEHLAFAQAVRRPGVTPEMWAEIDSLMED